MGKQTSIIFSKSNTFHHVYAQNLWLTETASGEYILNFYTDSAKIPDSIEYEISEEGRLGSELKRTPPPEKIEIIRELSVGVIIKKETIGHLADFLTSLSNRGKE